MNKIKETATKLATTKETYHLIVVLLVIFVAYQAFVVVPQRNEQRKIEAEKREQTAKALKYTFCVMEAETDYLNTWNSNCPLSGISSRQDGCSLPSRLADSIDGTLEDEKNRCVTLYK